MNSVSKSITVQGEIWLFEIPFLLEGVFKDEGADRVVRFSVRVGRKTLGEVLRYMLEMVGGPQLRLDPPWNVIESIRLDSFAFELEMRNGRSRYGLSYTDLGIDLTFAQFDKLEVFYAPRAADAPNPSLDVNVFGTFLGVDFTREPIGWDALKEQPPQAPATSKNVFRLDYLGLGQRVTLRDISSLDTVGKVVTALRNSYEALAEGTINPLAKNLPALTYDESAAWLVGAKFSVLDTFDFSGLWNLPKLAGARIALNGERAKSLAGFEFEILYRRIAADLGQYRIELVLPDVLRRFQAGAASVTLPIIEVEIYTDGGFKIDLGFPRNLNFERSFSVEFIVWAGPVPIPVTAAVGIYFGRLSALAVPGLPAIRGGSFGTVVVAGLGLRVGLGKSFRAGILEAGFFLGVEGMIEGVVGFYEPFEASEPKSTYYRVTGYLQLTGHIYGKVDFSIVSAAVDIYAYVSVQATFEAYRATPVTFEAGVSVSLSVKVGIGWFSFTVRLSFSATVREQFVFGQDQQTPWQLASDLGTTLAERLGPVGYRRLPGGTVVADAVFARLLDPAFDLREALATRARKQRPAALKGPVEAARLELYFRPIVSLGIVGDRPGQTPDPAKAEVNLVAALTLRTSRKDGELRSPAETYAAELLRWGLMRVREQAWAAGADALGEKITLSELHYLQDHLNGADPPIRITPEDVDAFFTEWVALALLPADWADNPPTLTAFPMIPFLTLAAGDGGTKTYGFNFEAAPLCSPEYQQNIRRYFEATDPMRGPPSDAEGIRGVAGDDLSMASLIFLDGFKLVLKKVVADAIDELRLLDVPAEGRPLAQIAADCGMGHPAGLARIVAANLDNAKFFAPNTALTVAADGVALGGGETLASLALRLEQPLLKLARAVYTQPILDPAAAIALAGVQHLITATDTQASILAEYGIASWDEVLAANPTFDWAVPEAVPDSHYPTLELPAGSWIELPVLQLLPTADRTLADVCEGYGVALSAFTGQPQAIPLAGEGLARPGIAVHAREGETLAALAGRIGFVGPRDVARGLLDDPSIFAAAGTVAIPQGWHLIARGDTLQQIAIARQIAPEAIVLANVDEPWKLIPRPNTSESLPMGVTLTLPPVAGYRPQPGETFNSIALLFGIAPMDFALHNSDTLVLPALTEVVLPPFAMPTPEVAPSPTDAALPFGVNPAGLVRANQGAAGGQGKEAPLDTVWIPDCEAIEEERLLARLAEGGETSQLSLATQAQARFILAGLRLPAPGGAAELAVPGPDEPLWPLYSLTGQQWPAPATPSETCWVELSWNATPGARRLAAAARDAVPSPVRVNLTPNDVTLIADFRTVAADPARIQPELLARMPFPAYQQVKVEQALGAATAWSRPEPVHFVPQESTEVVSAMLMHEVPAGLRMLLPTAKAPRAPLVVSQTTPDPVTGQPLKHPLADIGWATRIDLQIRLAYGGDQDGGPLRTTYEALSIAAQGQADLEALRTYIETSHGSAPIDLYLLYAADPLGPVPGTMRSNVTTAEDRARVALLKSNLSTFSNPSFSLGAVPLAESDETHAGATLADGKAFLDLLWQISVTNGGGFFLSYPVGPDGTGFPESVFESGAAATVSIVAVLREDPGSPATIAPMRFHNILITAENLPGAVAALQVAASDRKVAAVPGSEPPVSEALQTIATAVGIAVAELATLNASNRALLRVGAVIEIAGKAPYTVGLGDDLLAVARAFDLSVEALAGPIGDQPNLLVIGAVMAVRPGWVAARSTVAPEQGGFQILRRKPVEPATVETRDEALDDAAYRIQALFQLMGYALDKAGGYSASNAGLPVIPQDADQDLRQTRFGVSDGEAQPWAYRRLLPLAPFAGPDRFEQLPSLDPYAGLGRTAQIGVMFQDVFGNRLPRSEPQVKVSWPQLYRDPLVPLHAWPSVTLSYDVDRRDEWNAPQVSIRVKFAPAGYAADIGLTADRMRQRAETDQRQYALIYYQVAGGRIDAEALTTLTGDIPAAIDSYRLARLAKDAWYFLEATRRLEPLVVTLAEDTTLTGLALAAAVPVSDVALHLARQDVLRVGATLLVPEQLTVLPNTSLEQIADWTGGTLEPGRIGQLNADVALTPGLFLAVGGKEVRTKEDDTLRRVAARGGGKIPTVARDNAAVKGLFVEGSQLALGATEQSVASGQTLGAIADARAVRLEALAMANAERPIFAPGAQAELPLHLSVPAGTPSTAPIAEGQSLDDFVLARGAAIRDVLTANGATTPLLRAGETMYFRKPEGGGEFATEVGAADTLATIALRFAALVDDPSLKPADVGAYSKNSANTRLLLPGSLLLLPPIRFGKEIDVAHSASRAVTIDTLGVEIRVFRNDPALIDPAFADAPEVREVRSAVPARLSSAFSLDERATLKAFARQFQKTFDNLKLGVGPEVVASAELPAAIEDKPHSESKLLAVHWGTDGFDAEVHGPPVFFAPRPLLTTPWSATGVEIRPYVPGQPLIPPGGGGATPTNFDGVDLERWAAVLLGRIDRVLKPDLAVPLRAMAPADFEKIVNAKATIAEAVSQTVEPVLEPVPGADPPDKASAAEQLKQQLLVELAGTFGAGVVIQYDVKARVPRGSEGRWTAKTAPRLLGAVSPRLPAVPAETPTLDGLADLLGASTLLVAELVGGVGDLLGVGFVVPVGERPVVGPLDTIDDIAAKAGVGLAGLVAVVEDLPGFLRPGAEVPLSHRKTVTDVDDTLASVLERLSSNLTTKDLEECALDILLTMNGDRPGVFVAGCELAWKNRRHTTTAADSMNGVAQALRADPVQLYLEYLVAAPLLATGAPFVFLARVPPVTISPCKITLFDKPDEPNKLNAVFVTTGSDEVSSVSLDLRFTAEAMEYSIHDVPSGEGYQASEWLTFVDFDLGLALGPVDVPLPDRQFPLPPQVLSHDVRPRVADGKVDAARLGDVMLYDYNLKFAFDAAAQDEIFYTRHSDDDAMARLSGDDALARHLAQYQAIDAPLWDDVFRLRGWNDPFPPEDKRQIVVQAVAIFAELAREIAESWSRWSYLPADSAPGERYRVRRHRHPDGRALVSVAALAPTKASAGRTLPHARLLGRAHRRNASPQMAATAIAAPVPVPRTRRGEFYEVVDPDLNLLAIQRCWGGISVTRNRSLVEGARTAAPFVLRMPDARAVQYLTPSFTYAQRVDAGSEIGPLEERLQRIFEQLFFPGADLPDLQRVSVTASFARPLAVGERVAAVEPVDATTLFSPVATTPLLPLTPKTQEGKPDPAELARRLADYLTEELTRRGISPREAWSLTVKLFARSGTETSASQLLEMADLRVRMSDQ